MLPLALIDKLIYQWLEMLDGSSATVKFILSVYLHVMWRLDLDIAYLRRLQCRCFFLGGRQR